MLSIDRAESRIGVWVGVSLTWALLTLGATSCSHHRVVLQVYGGDEQSDVALAEFAAGRGLALEKPVVAPVHTDQPVVMFGQGWETYEAAMELEELLRNMGRDVRLVEGFLRNHVVTRGHIAVFLDTAAAVGGTMDAVAVAEVHQLLCTQDHGEALVLLFDSFDMEIQTYVWKDETVAGFNHYGTWTTSADKVSLLPSDGGALEYESGAACLTGLPDGSGSCRGSLRWLRGDSVPMLAGCDLEVRDLIMAAHPSELGGLEGVSRFPSGRR